MKRLHYPASNDEFDDACDLDMLLHPAQAFEHPSEVVNDHDLTLNEKRAILASWASDACAIEAVPTLRCLPGGKRPVPFDEVMDALRRLDEVVRRIGGTSQNRHALGGSRKPSSNEGPDDGRGHSLS
jgi:hypothetical protein